MMNFIIRFLTILSPYIKRIGTCAKAGIIIGAFAGLMLALLDLERGGLSLTTQEALYVSLILTGFVWLVILFILCVFIRMTLRSIALPTLVNSFLTCLVTVFLSRYLGAYTLAWLIGIIVGLLIGLLLCRLNNLFKKINN